MIELRRATVPVLLIALLLTAPALAAPPAEATAGVRTASPEPSPAEPASPSTPSGGTGVSGEEAGTGAANGVVPAADVLPPSPTPPPAATPAVRAAIDRAVQSVYPALVRIDVVTTSTSDGRLRKHRASGSGTIISPDGYVLTNHHVAGKATRIVCRLSDRTELEAQLIGTDAMTDLAILKLDLSALGEDPAPLPVAQFGDSDALRVGDTVLAMGSPAGLSQSVTAGIVSNTEMIPPHGAMFQLDGEPVGLLVRWIGHDAVIYPGNSGGPLVDLEGRIIGVNEIGIGSLGGAIPANLARNVAQQLIEGQCVQRSWTGMQMQPLLKSMNGTEGVLVAGVIEGSPAETAGVQSGDIVQSFDGVKVHAAVPEELPALNRLVLGTPIGKDVTVEVLRDGEAKSFTLALAAREPAQHPEREIKDWGLTVRDLTLLESLNRRRSDSNGVLVDSVRPSGPASEAKPSLYRGDIIVRVGDHDVKDLDALRRVTADITRDASAPVPTLVAFDRGLERMLTVVEIGHKDPEPKPIESKKAWLGVETQVLTRNLARALGLVGKKGVRVTRVLPHTTAETAGLQVGDILLKLDGEVIPAQVEEDREVFEHRIRQYRIGSQVELTGVRDGEPLTIAATLEDRPLPEAELQQYTDESFEFAVRELGFRDRTDRELAPEEMGVIVRSVEPAGWAALAGLYSGDIISRIGGEAVRDVEHLEAIMQRIVEAKPKRVVFFVRRGIHTAFIELEPDWKLNGQE